MRKLLLTAVLPVMMASFAVAADVASEVEKAEREFVAAVVRSDAAAVGRYLASDLVYTHSGGARDTRESYLEKISKGQMKYEKWDIEKLETQTVTGDVAIVAARAAVRVVGAKGPVEMNVSLLHVFAKRQGRWQLVAHQSARLP